MDDACFMTCRVLADQRRKDWRHCLSLIGLGYVVGVVCGWYLGGGL